MRSSSSGMPSMFSAREVAAERRFQGWAAASSGGTPRAVNQSCNGQLPRRGRARGSRPAAASPPASRGRTRRPGPSRRPPAAARPSAPPAPRPVRGRWPGGRPARPGGGLRQVAVMAGQERGSSALSWAGPPVVSRSFGQEPELRGGRGAGRRPPGAGRVPAARGSPAARRLGGRSRPSSAAWRSSWPSRSSGWTQVSRSIDGQHPARSRRTPPRGPRRWTSRAKTSRATAASVGAGSCRSRRLASATCFDQSADRIGAASAPAIAPAIVAIESQSRP